MEDQKIYNLALKRGNWVAHTIYWLVAAFLMLFIFSNRNYDQNIRLVLVGYIIIISYIITQLVNNFLIRKFLFTGKLWVFIYLTLGVFVTNLWLIIYSSILIVIYSMSYLPHIMVPQKDDILILVSGSYLIIILAAVIHFIKESYRKLEEKNLVEEQKQKTELKLKEANLKLLQSQIHPHFLFNMLNNLYGLVNDDVKSSREIIVKLSELLDYMLYKCDKPRVNLSDEIIFIENYIELERVRHDENFNVNTSFPDNLSLKIAPLILFPFVENAFKHGFHDPQKNSITIKLEVKEDQLIFTCENSITKVHNDKYLKQEGRGIGLRNIKERLELIYYDKYKLNISELENIFKVSLEIYLN